MNLKESICEILSNKKAKCDGLHIKHIALYNLNNNLFSDANEIDFYILKREVNRILANEVKKKRKKYVYESDKPKDDQIQEGLLQI